MDKTYQDGAQKWETHEEEATCGEKCSLEDQKWQKGALDVAPNEHASD